MTDTPAAYQTALDQLRAERDAALARAKAAETEWAAIAQTPDGGWHLAHQQAAARAEAAENERDQLQREVTSLSTKLEVVTAERDDLAQKLSGNWIEREVDARLMTEIGTGPVAHERNQLRDDNLKLREEVATLAAELDGTRSRLTMTTRDLDQSERAVTVLSTIIRASVEAIARGVK